MTTTTTKKRTFTSENIDTIINVLQNSRFVQSSINGRWTTDEMRDRLEDGISLNLDFTPHQVRLQIHVDQITLGWWSGNEVDFNAAAGFANAVSEVATLARKIRDELAGI